MPRYAVAFCNLQSDNDMLIEIVTAPDPLTAISTHSELFDFFDDAPCDTVDEAIQQAFAMDSVLNVVEVPDA